MTACQALLQTHVRRLWTSRNQQRHAPAFSEVHADFVDRRWAPLPAAVGRARGGAPPRHFVCSSSRLRWCSPDVGRPSCDMPRRGGGCRGPAPSHSCLLVLRAPPRSMEPRSPSLGRLPGSAAPRPSPALTTGCSRGLPLLGAGPPSATAGALLECSSGVPSGFAAKLCTIAMDSVAFVWMRLGGRDSEQLRGLCSSLLCWVCAATSRRISSSCRCTSCTSGSAATSDRAAPSSLSSDRAASASRRSTVLRHSDADPFRRSASTAS
mmetsp:Transcript_112951/g.306697  ORF Transcript_112951/g.306697 Transcript_112951/m.306697 type:complete len:266 (+) Transcript_112951:150-947(+)